MSAFLNYPGYRNVFSCIKCEISRTGCEELVCAECGAYACKHLTVEAFGEVCCFCCFDDNDDRDWPDWCFTMVPESLIRGKNER